MYVHHRRRNIIDVLARLYRGEGDFAVLEDEDEPDNYVQIKDFGAGKMATIEVSSRTYPDQVLPPLAAAQVLSLKKLGFHDVPNPNYRGTFPSTSVLKTAALIEQVFSILGSAPDFDLEILRLESWND